MDTFWDFIEPLVYNNNLLIKYDEFLKTQFGFKETFQVRIHDVYPTESKFALAFKFRSFLFSVFESS